MARSPGKSRRLVVALVVAATVVVGLGATALAANSTSSPRTTPLTVPACSSTSQVNWLDTVGNGTAGSIYYTLKFTNLAAHSCTIKGYPGVSAVSLSGKQIGSPAGRAASTAKLITLAKGATANALLQVIITGNFSPNACKSVTAAGLKVYAPNQTGSNIIPFPFATCSKVGEISLYVQAVTKS